MPINEDRPNMSEDTPNENNDRPANALSTLHQLRDALAAAEAAPHSEDDRRNIAELRARIAAQELIHGQVRYPPVAARVADGYDGYDGYADVTTIPMAGVATTVEAEVQERLTEINERHRRATAEALEAQRGALEEGFAAERGAFEEERVVFRGQLGIYRALISELEERAVQLGQHIVVLNDRIGEYVRQILNIQGRDTHPDDNVDDTGSGFPTTTGLRRGTRLWTFTNR